MHWVDLLRRNGIPVSGGVGEPLATVGEQLSRFDLEEMNRITLESTLRESATLD